MELRHLQPFLEPILTVCRAQFPRNCSSCGREFRDFRDYLVSTQPVGVPTDYTAGLREPLGLVSWETCACETTLTLRWEDRPGEGHRALMDALAREVRESGCSEAEVLQRLREAVRTLAIGAVAP